MPYDTRSQLGPDECLRILRLIPARASTDYAMSVSSRNGSNTVEGESLRLVDKRARLDIEGYYNSVARLTGSGHAGQLEGSSLIVVRYCDKATASLGSILHSYDDTVEVKISTYKATGEGGTELQSALELDFGAAMITQQVLLTGGADGRPMEILAFSYRQFVIRSAPQNAAGAIGPVSTCRFMTGSSTAGSP